MQVTRRSLCLASDGFIERRKRVFVQFLGLGQTNICKRSQLDNRERHLFGFGVVSESAESADVNHRELAIVDILNPRSEEHTSELQSRENLVCRLLLEKKKKDT